MATYVLIHGASSDSWYWHLVIPELQARGHSVVAPDLPIEDDSAGFCQYADVVIDAIGDRRQLVVVAQSMGGFTAPLVCRRVPVELVILVAAMVPSPGESPGQWWESTGFEEAKRAQDERDGRPSGAGLDPLTTFFHDAPADVVAEAMGRGERHQSGSPFSQPYPFDGWPAVPTRFLLCRHDRFFPAEFLRRVVTSRLGIVPDEMDGGHLPALSHPAELVARLEGYRIQQLG
jgi:pimeloyl-ACP methyl ester carboxylesterase